MPLKVFLVAVDQPGQTPRQAASLPSLRWVGIGALRWRLAYWANVSPASAKGPRSAHEMSPQVPRPHGHIHTGFPARDKYRSSALSDNQYGIFYRHLLSPHPSGDAGMAQMSAQQRCPQGQPHPLSTSVFAGSPGVPDASQTSSTVGRISSGRIITRAFGKCAVLN